MKIDKGIRETVQAQLQERGFPIAIPEPTQPDWDDFRERLKNEHPDLYEQLLLGLRYDQFADPQTAQHHQAQRRKTKAWRKAALTQELDELTGQVVTSRPKVLLWGSLALLGFAGLVAWGVGISTPQKHVQKVPAVAVAATPQELETVLPQTPKPIPKPVTAQITPSKPFTYSPPTPTRTKAISKPIPEPSPENWSQPAPPPSSPIPISARSIRVRQPDPLPQTPFVSPPPPPLEQLSFSRPSPPKPTKILKAEREVPTSPSPDSFSLFAAQETTAESVPSAEEFADLSSFYLAGNQPPSSPNAPVVVGQFYQGQLASDLILTEGGRMTAVVVSRGSVWQGEASSGDSKRIELRFSQLSVGNKSYPLSAVGFGIENNRRVPGLVAQFRDEAPTLAADALRGALRGVSRYVDLANQSGSTTVSSGVVVNQPGSPDLLSNVAGSLAELLAVPAGERALVRIATVPQGTPVQLLVQSLGETTR